MVRPLLCFVLLALTACSKPQPPEKERRPEPQAREESTELPDAIQAPINKAKGVEDEVQKAADEQRAAIDAATGG
jgi:hypothetical protein